MRLALARGANVIGVDRNVDCKPLEGDPEAELPPEYLRGGGGGGGGEGEDDDVRFVGRILRTELGPHEDATFAAADVIVLSPGVPLTQPQVAAALLQSSTKSDGGRGGEGESEGEAKAEAGSGVIVISELAFASQCLPSTLPVAAVTGTNGKSTVCTFVGQLLGSRGARAFVGGNLGTPLSDCAFEFVAASRKREGSSFDSSEQKGMRGQREEELPLRDDDVEEYDDMAAWWPYDAAVVECSSYQLEHPGALRFDAACVINLTPDHMERHGSMEAYATAKARIFAALRGIDGGKCQLALLPAGGEEDVGGRGRAEGGGRGGEGEEAGDGGGRRKDEPAAGLEAAGVDWNDIGAAMLERARSTVIEEANVGGGVGGGGGGLDVATAHVGGVLAHIGSLPGVVVDSTTRTATVQLPWRRPAESDAPDAASAGGGDGSSSSSSSSSSSPPAAAAADDGNDDETIVVDLSPLTAVGAHNANNAGVALLLAHSMDPVRFSLPRLAPGLAMLTPPPHRMQLVAHTSCDEEEGEEDEKGGGIIQWVDDSKATNVEAAAAGLRGYERRAVVLLGGMAKEGVGPGGKGLGFAALVPALRRHQAVITFGGSGPAIAEELRAAGLNPAAEVGSMFDAVATARELVRPGGAVVLSPACASFDEFDNFVHRGLVFADLANGRPPTPSADNK